MTSTRVKRQPEETLGEGNCAFNAFALALCAPQILYQIERNILSQHLLPDVVFDRFIHFVSAKLNIKRTWHAVKAELSMMRNENKHLLQRILAPFLRQLSIDLAEEEYEVYYQQAFPVFMGTFHGYTKEYKRDDIYCKHDFIMNEFDSVNNLAISDSEKNRIIEAWWLTEGHRLFLHAMRQDGEWAGDLELARLAKYFDAVLEVERGQTIYGIHGNFGYFPFLHDNQEAKSIPAIDQYTVVACLYSRDVIRSTELTTGDSDGFLFNIPSLREVYQRLGRIPNFDKVDSFIKQQGRNLSGSEVPNWSRDCKEALIARTVIGLSSTDKRYIFNVGAERAAIHIREVPHYQTVIEICRKHYQIRPLLVLNHCGENHWQNMLALPTAEEELIQRLGMYGKQGVQRMHEMLLAEPSLRKSDDRLSRKLT